MKKHVEFENPKLSSLKIHNSKDIQSLFCCLFALHVGPSARDSLMIAQIAPNCYDNFMCYLHINHMFLNNETHQWLTWGSVVTKTPCSKIRQVAGCSRSDQKGVLWGKGSGIHIGEVPYIDARQLIVHSHLFGYQQFESFYAMNIQCQCACLYCLHLFAISLVFCLQHRRAPPNIVFLSGGAAARNMADDCNIRVTSW